MESLWSFFSLAPQCCDAFTYVVDGQNCALTGACSNSLRPQGVFYWFSIPLRFGLPLNSLILFNVLLMTISAGLSVVALHKTFNVKNNTRHVRWCSFLVLALASFFIHLVFQYPTLFNTLTDAPSSSLFLIGSWLLLLSAKSTKVRNIGVLAALGGLCWGFSAWLRAFYLYPVLCGIAIYILFWLFNRKRIISQLFILLALLPIGSQYLHTYQNDGNFSYLGARANYFVDMHSAVASAGYDTVFPADGYHWPPSRCTAHYGMLTGLQAHEFAQVGCLIRERLYFYLGTYEKETFRTSHKKNKLAFAYIEHPGEPVGWWLDSTKIVADVAHAPDNTLTADKVVALLMQGGSILKPIQLKENTTYTLSMWLWSPSPTTIELALIKNIDRQKVASKNITLTATPQRYSITGTTSEIPGLLPANIGMEAIQYSASIRFSPDTSDAAATREKYFYVWNAQLEAADHMTEFQPYEWPEPDDIRVWQPSLLILNMVIISLAFVATLTYRDTWLKQGAGLAILVAILVSAAACVDIIPEQRFATTPLIAIWLMATILVLGYVNALFNKKY